MNKWDQRYKALDYVYGKEPNQFLAEHAHLIPPGKALCLADGEGRNGVYLASLGHQVTSLDSSRIGLQKAEALAAETYVTLETLCLDLADYRFPENAFTGIVSIFCHLPSDLRRATYAQVSQSLQPGGVFILEAYTPDQLDLGSGGPSDRELLVTLDELRSEVSGLDFVLARELRREVVEGSLHTGLGAVVQIVARKRYPEW